MAIIDESQIEEDVYHFCSEQMGNLPVTEKAIEQAAYREVIDFIDFEEQDDGEPVTEAQMEEYQRIWIKVYKRVAAQKPEEIDALLQAIEPFDAAELGKQERRKDHDRCKANTAGYEGSQLRGQPAHRSRRPASRCMGTIPGKRLD